MNKLSIISLVVVVTGTLIGCSDVKRNPGRIYMPDMTYSRAYETYAPHQNLKDSGINYTAMPVAGTIKRGELFPFAIAQDAIGDTTNHVASRKVKNPLLAIDSTELVEAERMYLINCGICHGSKLDGNGPLYKDGNGPFPSKPAVLVGDAKIEALTDGELFYTMTYGKNNMGSYASQLSTTQRWRVVQYIRSKQGKGGAAAPVAGGAAASDSASKAPVKAAATK